MKLKLEEVQRLAEEEFGKLMPDVELVKVKVKPGEDWEGDEILDIIIVYDTKKKKKVLDADKTTELLSQVRMSMVDKEDERFPIVSFVIKSEARQLRIGT